MYYNKIYYNIVIDLAESLLVWGVLKTKTPKTPKDPKTWKQRPPIFFGALKLRPVSRQYDCKLSIGDKNFSVSDWHSRNWFRFKSKNFVFWFKQGTYPLSLQSF